MDYIIQDGELYHHGIPGMKWGVRRFQNKDGSLTQAGKKRISRKQKKALEKARKAKHDKAEAAKKAKQEQEDFEKNKKKAIESGSAADVLKYKGKLTNQELQQAVFRINMEKQLSDISSKETKTGLDRAEKLMDKVERVNKMAGKGIDAWNTIAKVLNSTSGSDLPLISDKKSEKAKKKIEKEADKTIKKIEKAQQKQEKRAEKESAGDKIKRSFDTFNNKKPAENNSSDSLMIPKKVTIKRDVKDLANAKWVKKESDNILDEIKNDHISDYGHRQDIVDAVNRYIEELDN